MTFVFTAMSRIVSAPRNALIVMTDCAARMRSPIVAVGVTIARVVIVVSVVVVVMHMDTGTAVPVVMTVIVAVIRMTVIAVMIDMQAVCEPADSKRCGHAPEETTRE